MSTSQSFLPTLDDMFRPPVNHCMKVLDRSFFQKRVNISAVKIHDKQQIQQCRKDLGRDILTWNRCQRMIEISENGHQPARAILMKPEIKAKDSSTWSQKLQELVDIGKVTVIPYTLNLSYKDYSYADIMDAVLPRDGLDELPSGYSVCGHIAHFNLRDHWLPYKNMIANVLLDKSNAVRTVINKTEPVSEQSTYRTFNLELLAGIDDLNVTHMEENCVYRFDYSKCYYNSKLHTEHRRLVTLFQPGEAVCDVMAGVGPFALPSGKKNVFVWANDLNPDCYSSLKDNIKRNKVAQFVRAFNEDGKSFIRTATQSLLHTKVQVTVVKNVPSKTPHLATTPSERVVQFFTQPKTFNHYIMNLPGSALSFLPSFVSLYAGHESIFAPHTDAKLPLIHVYCFSPWDQDPKSENARKIKICENISEQLGYKLSPEDPEVDILFTRRVSQLTAMYCASFRLPPEVAFRKND